MSFSATDAAFEGFRLVRRNPLVLLAWTLLYLVVGVASLLAMSSMAPAIAELGVLAEALNASEPQSFDDVAPVLNAYGRLLSGMGWLIVLSIVINIMLSTAVARSVLAGNAKDAFGHVRLGMDELRAAVVTLVLMIVFSLIAVVVFLLVGLVAGFAAAAIDAWGWVVGLTGFLAAAGFMIWLTVRLSLAIPITVAEKKMAFFDSFRVTRGRFWPLLGMIFLALVMALLVGLLSMLISLPISLMSGIGNPSLSDDPAAMLSAYSFTNPWVLAYTAINAVISALVFGVMYAPFAAAYRDLSGRGDDAAA